MDSTYIGLIVALGVLSVVAVLAHARMNSAERRLLTGAAIVMAGMFIVARQLESLPLSVFGMLICLAGLGMLVVARREIRVVGSTRLGSLAVIVVLPLAFFGALLAAGLFVTVVSGPAQAAMQLFGR